MNAVPDFGVGVGNVLRLEAVVDRFPVLSAVVGPETAGGGDGDEDSILIRRIDTDRVKPQPAGARSPLRAVNGAQPRQLIPVLSAVGRLEDGGVFDAGVDRIRVTQRRLKMPDSLEL